MKSAARVACAVAVLGSLGCQTVFRAASGNLCADSSDSSQGSSDATQASNESSKTSVESSDASNESTKSSGDSSKPSQDSTKSSNDSTGNSAGPLISTTAVGATVIVVSLLLWTPRARAAASLDVRREAAAYVAERSLQLRQDLAIGAGPAIDELAALAEIPTDHVAHLGRLMHADRRELQALSDTAGRDPEQGLAFLERVGALAKSDALLATDWQSFLSRHPEGS